MACRVLLLKNQQIINVIDQLISFHMAVTMIIRMPQGYYNIAPHWLRRLKDTVMIQVLAASIVLIKNIVLPGSSSPFDRIIKP